MRGKDGLGDSFVWKALLFEIWALLQHRVEHVARHQDVKHVIEMYITLHKYVTISAPNIKSCATTMCYSICHDATHCYSWFRWWPRKGAFCKSSSLHSVTASMPASQEFPDAHKIRHEIWYDSDMIKVFGCLDGIDTACCNCRKCCNQRLHSPFPSYGISPNNFAKGRNYERLYDYLQLKKSCQLASKEIHRLLLVPCRHFCARALLVP